MAVTLLVSGLLLSSPVAFGQQNPPRLARPGFPSPPIAHVGEEANVPLTKFDLDFPGGTPSELVRAIEKASLVGTGSGRDMFNEVDDQQLLAFLSGRPAALVRQGPHEAELMFLNPEDRNGFPVH